MMCRQVDGTPVFAIDLHPKHLRPFDGSGLVGAPQFGSEVLRVAPAVVLQ